MIPKLSGTSDRDRVLELTDLVALIGESVVLRPKGREHLGLCPFHEDHKPSFAVVTHKGNAFYNCFSCQASGNAIDFMMNYHRMDFPEALKFLAQRAGIELTKRASNEPKSSEPESPAALRRANESAQRFFRRCLADASNGAAVRDALEKRGISPAMVERFGLGAAPANGHGLVDYIEKLISNQDSADPQKLAPEFIRASFEAAGLTRSRGGLHDGFRNRAMFPICDELGRCIAFGARAIDPEDQPKYLNSPESALFHKGKSLYGIHLAKRAIIASRTAIITEGYTDVIACHAAGIENAVATLGTALTRDHAAYLQKICDTIILLFDGDAAGQRAADRALELFFAAPVDLKICTLPDEMDPDELLREADGRVKFDAALAESKDALTHMVGQFAVELAQRPGLSARQRTVEAMMTKLATLGLSDLDGIRRRFVMDAIAQASGLPVSELEREVSSKRRAGGSRSNSPTTTVAQVSTERAAPTPQAVAERDFVSILLAWPAVATTRILDARGESTPLTELITPETLQDSFARTIYNTMFEWLESGRTTVTSVSGSGSTAWTMQEILAELPEQADKSLAVELFSLGSGRFVDDESARNGLSVAAQALERMQLRSQLSQTPSATTPEELDRRLERIRAIGHRPSAIARTARSAS